MENQTGNRMHSVGSQNKKINNKSIVAFVIMCIALFLLLFDNEPQKEYRFTEGFIFGTTYHITYSSSTDENLDANIKSAFYAVDNSLSMFNKNSTVSRINESDTVVRPDSLFMKVWCKGYDISCITDGSFDMTVAPLVDLWGFGLENRQKVSQYQVDSIKQYIGWKKIEEVNGNIIKQSEHVRIDAGAIAKGFACDVVLDTLIAHGCTDACVEIGGEVAVLGLNSKGKTWRIGINAPIDDSLSVVNEIQTIVSLSSGGMATSGNYRNFYMDGGRKFSHTINPETGYPVLHNLLSATIIADDCMTADAWATACMVAGLGKAEEWIESRMDLEGYLIYEENGDIKVWSSSGFPVDKKQ